MQNVYATGAVASLAGLWQIKLTFNVINNRRLRQIRLGSGDSKEMEAVIRAHANFTENTPIFLILLGSYELNGGWKSVCLGVGAVFLAGRVIHSQIVDEVPNTPLISRVRGMIMTIASIGTLCGLNLALLGYHAIVASK